MTRLIAVACAAAAALAAASAFAQDATPYHLRGALDAVHEEALTITDDSGATRDIALGAETRIFVVDAAALDDIAEGQFVGITSIVSGDERVALEVHIFEESLRGVGEGHYPWTLVEEENMMTNANVATMVAVDENRRLTVEYTEGEEGARTSGTQTIVVPPSAAVVHLSAGDRAALVPGERMFILAVDGEDGAAAAIAAAVGRDGVEPPM